MIGKIYNWNQKEQLVVFRTDEESDLPESYIFINNERKLQCMGKIWDDFELDTTKIHNGDILEISESGVVKVVFFAGISEIDIFVTNHCNSNCIMCPLSESARRQEKPEQAEWVKNYIKLLPEHIAYVNVTGGEPTMAGEDFFEIMYLLKEKFQYSGFQLLTNGRSLADKSFLEDMMQVLPFGTRFAIPFHCAREEVHDAITCSFGSFQQTVQGIHNLIWQDMKVEIRIVLSKKNAEYLLETAEYIIHYFKGVFCVNFIAMEMMGNAAKNKDELWENYSVLFQKAKRAIILLVQNGVDVQLYNFPLCTVEKGFWSIAVKSITDYKIRYMEACNSCRVKSICGGFFYSTKQLMCPEVYPMGDEYAD